MGGAYYCENDDNTGILMWSENWISAERQGFEPWEQLPVHRMDISGKTGIRTLGTVTRSPHFECGPIDHSGIFPLGVAK